MKKQYEKDLNQLIGYIITTKYEKFLDHLSESGAKVLNDEEVNTLLNFTEYPEVDDLISKECASPEQNHIYAIAWRLMAEG